MLVLARKVGEKILIGDNISVTVVRIAQGVVRIGIEAPNETPIIREEIRDQVQQPDRKKKPPRPGRPGTLVVGRSASQNGATAHGKRDRGAGELPAAKGSSTILSEGVAPAEAKKIRHFPPLPRLSRTLALPHYASHLATLQQVHDPIAHGGPA